MGSDARVRYTKKVIADSFIDLLEAKPLSRITVSEICRNAEINRATFYRHYRDPLDLAEQLENELLTELAASLEQTFTDFDGFFEGLLENIRNDGRRYRALSRARKEPQLLVKAISLSREMLTGTIEQTYPNLAASERELLFSFAGHGCSGVITQWMNEGMRQDPREVATSVKGMIDGIMSRYEASCN